MWSLPEIIVQNNPELAGEETEETKYTKALNRRVALATKERKDEQNEAQCGA